MSSQPPQPPRKRPFRWGKSDPDHPIESWWGSWLRRGSPKKWRPPNRPGPPPPGQPPAA